MTTVCGAWRWKTVAGRLGVELSLPAAVAACYRSQFLNVTLPGGVVGDVHRGISHGRDVRDLGRGLRAVACERAAGQVVQVVLTVGVLLALPSPVHSSMPLVAIAFASALAVADHAFIFLIAARTAGTTAPLSQMVPLALLVMMAMVLPSAGGWGPREVSLGENAAYA